MFFLDGRPLRLGRDELPRFELLEAAGLAMRRSRTIFEPCVRVFPFLGEYVATDLLTYREADQVFSLMFEQVYLARNTSVAKGDAVLELCVGSGAASLIAARRAAEVTGIDLSPRALAFARFNASLNAPPAPLELVEGSLFDPVPPDRRFDVVMVNPPFEPVPAGAEHFLHSHGGEDGLDVVRELLGEAPGRLAPGGRLEIVTFSPGSDREPLLAELLRDAFPDGSVAVHVLGEEPLESYQERWRESPGYDTWRSRLADAGLTRLWFVFARAMPGGPPACELTRPEGEISICHGISDEW